MVGTIIGIGLYFKFGFWPGLGIAILANIVLFFIAAIIKASME